MAAAEEEPETHATAAEMGGASRKERRKAAKKGKRKQKRREIAEKEKAEEEARVNDPEERRRAEAEEEREREREERERAEFEERERVFLLELAEKKRKEEEREREAAAAEEEFLKLNQVPHEDENESDCEYIEDGPPEIIWQGNEIIVKKKKIKVKRKDADQQSKIEESGRPTSNPFPPENEPFAVSKNGSVVSAQQVLDNAAQQIPNFGTEQDKAHCPFQIKTGTCRFGLRCSRLHFYPDKSCTLLIKNMYNGPGLAFEQDEGLEHTDEEVDRCFEDFYEDVHTEFLKFGEIVNFKVCKNSSFHLRGNLYVHYKSQDSAMLAYQSVNGRYFAGKQVTCEFVGVTKWRVAICGEFMRSRLKTCSRGAACNFIHCFRNPGGDYEWADWDKPPPKYWVQEMAALFGTSQHFSETTTDMDRSQSRERKSSRDHRHDEYGSRRSRHHKMHPSRSRKEIEYHRIENRVHGSDSDRGESNSERGEDRYHGNTKGSVSALDNKDYHEFRTRRSDSDAYWSDIDRERDKKRNRDRDRDRKRDEDMHYKPNGKSSTPKRTNRDKLYNDDDVELMVEDRDRKRDEDVHYKPKRKSSTSKRKSRDRWDSADDGEFIVKDNDRERDKDMHYNRKRKSRDRWDSVDDSEFMLEDKDRERDDGMHYNPKRKSRDRWDSADDSEVMLENKYRKRNEDVHYNSKEKKSTPKRKSRDRWDSTDDRELMVEEDKSERHKRSRKSSRHSNEERDFIEGVERRGRWDDKLGV